jgi:ligand-binding sensor domain-containing protein
MPTVRGVRRTGVLIVSVMLWCVASPAAAQPRPVAVPGQLQWVVGGSWRLAEGLPQDRVSALRQTRDGYIWVGTRGGVARFDGVRFTVWDTEPGSNFPDGEGDAFAEAPDGSLWVGVYGGGLVHFRDGRFSTLTKADGLVDNDVRCVTIDAEGAVWIGTERGLSRLHQGHFTNYHLRDGLGNDAVGMLFSDPMGSGVLIGTSVGLQRIVDGRFSSIDLLPTKTPVSVGSVVRDRVGRLWVGSAVGLFLVSGSSVRQFGPQQGLSSSTVRAVYEDSKGRIWVATNAGLDRADFVTDSARPFMPVLDGAECTTIIEDREGSVWVGTRGFGLYRLHVSLFSVFDRTSGLGPGGATTVFEASDKTVWAGVGTWLVAIRKGFVQNYGRETDLPGLAISSLAEDSAHHLWVGTERGLFRSRAPVIGDTSAGSLRFVPVSGDPALGTHIRVLCPDGDGVMLAGTNADGVVRIAADGQTTNLPAVARGEVRAIVREPSGRIWVGTRNQGLIRLDGDTATRYTPREGLAHINVQSLYLDRDGALWIATRHGVSWIIDGKLQSVTAEQGLHQNHVYGITEDSQARLWMSSGSGLFTVAEAELRAVAAGVSTQVTSVVYGLEHGLPTTMFALSHHPVIMTGANGHVWAAAPAGIVEVDPSQSGINAIPPPVRLERIAVNGQAFDPGSAVHASAGRGGLDFAFTALTYVAPRKVSFRYRLEGFDPAWIEGGTAREARFTNIPPGQYRFTVAARNRDGAWNSVGASVDIVLVPLFYQAGWFRALSALVIIGLFVSVGSAWHRRRVALLEANDRELRRRVDEAVAHIKVLRGLLPVCAWCHRVRDDDGYWTQMEAYVREHSQAEFSHSLCPDCLKEHFPDDADGVQTEGRTKDTLGPRS